MKPKVQKPITMDDFPPLPSKPKTTKPEPIKPIKPEPQEPIEYIRRYKACCGILGMDEWPKVKNLLYTKKAEKTIETLELLAEAQKEVEKISQEDLVPGDGPWHKRVKKGKDSTRLAKAMNHHDTIHDNIRELLGEFVVSWDEMLYGPLDGGCWCSHGVEYTEYQLDM